MAKHHKDGRSLGNSCHYNFHRQRHGPNLHGHGEVQRVMLSGYIMNSMGILEFGHIAQLEFRNACGFLFVPLFAHMLFQTCFLSLSLLLVFVSLSLLLWMWFILSYCCVGSVPELLPLKIQFNLFLAIMLRISWLQNLIIICCRKRKLLTKQALSSCHHGCVFLPKYYKQFTKWWQINQ